MSLIDDLRKQGEQPVVQTPFNSGGGYSGGTNNQYSGGNYWSGSTGQQNTGTQQQQRRPNPLIDDLEASGTKPEVDLYQLALEQAQREREEQARQQEGSAEKKTTGTTATAETTEKKSVWQRIKDFFTKDRAKNVADAAISGTAAGYTGAERVLYEAGQGGRTALYQEEADEARRNLEQAQRDLEQAKANGFSERDIASIQNRIDTWQQRYDALTYVTDNEVQQKATAATSDLTQQLEKRSQKATEKAKQGTGKFGSLAVDVAVNMMQMAGDAGVAAVTGGSALLPMGYRVLGQGASEAQQAGASIGQQLGYGAAAAGIELFTEKMADGLAGLYGKGAADDIVEKAIGKLARTNAGRSALRFIIGMGEEGLEEVISDILTPAAQMIYNGQRLGESYRNNFSASDMLYDFIIGAVASGGMTAVRPISTYREYSAANAELRAQEAAQQPATSAVQQQGQPAGVTAQAAAAETGQRLIEQTVSNLSLPEAQQRILVEGFELGNADAQIYARGIEEAFMYGRSGLSMEDSIERAQFGSELTRMQFQHAWELGAQRAASRTVTAEEPVKDLSSFTSIEEFSQRFPAPEKVSAIFDQAADTDLTAFAEGFRTAYDMGQSGVSANYATAENIPALTDAQRTAAFEMGRSDAATAATAQAARITAQGKDGDLSRVKGAVKGEGVTLADLKVAFNDSQNTAYRLLTRYAETTGVNIVLYNSQADTGTGLFPASQGRFQWKDNTIYIDINSGLNSAQDVNSLGQYTMLRTFAHEFTHFIEKWNATEYNEFREFVFSTLEARGENVHDLIEAMQARDETGKMTYAQASREVVADAMMDILPDSTLVQQLASEHRSIFKKLLQKMREFSARLKQYYRQISTKAPREAQALKDNGAYMDSIVQMWDRIAKGAVENYQRATGEPFNSLSEPSKRRQTEPKQPRAEKPDNLPKRSRANVHESAKDARSEQPETRRAGMDFFRPVQEGSEAAPDLRQQAGVQRVQTVNRDRFPANDLTSEAETGEDVRQQPGVTRLQPVGRERFAPNDLTSREETGERLLDRVPKKAAEDARSTAIRMAELGASPSEVFNATNGRYVMMANGNIRDTENGEIVYEGRKVQPGGREGGSSGRKAEGRIPQAGDSGNDGRGTESTRGSASGRGRTSLRTEEQREALRKAVKELLDNGGEELLLFAEDYESDLEFGEYLYNAWIQGDAVLETMAAFIPDIDGLKERFAGISALEAAETQEAATEAETPETAEAEVTSPQERADTPEGARLRETLSSRDEATVNGIRYRIAYDNSDEWRSKHWYGGLRDVSKDMFGGAVMDGRALTYSDFFGSREEAVDALVRAAENNHLLEGRTETTSESTEKPEVQAPPVGAAADADRNGDGAVRVSSELQEGDVQRDAAGRQPSPVSPEQGRRAGRHGDRADAERDGRSGSERSGESGVQPGRESQLKAEEEPEAEKPQEKKRRQKKLKETVEHEVEQKSTEAAGGNNYVIGESLDLPNGSKARYKANVDAIRLVKQIEAENRNATPEEQATLARYVGWGGIPEAFDQRKTEWSKEFAELKELLTDEEYKAAKGSTLNAHYTSIPVIRAMYRGLERLGFKGGRMLEPSSGVGNFVGAMPASMTANVRSWTMVELDNITGLIAKHLYPQSDVRIEGFEKTILPDNYMDVAIGNVPFGNYPVVDRTYPKKLTAAIHNYFFAKSLDKVRPGGLVIFITSSYTMNSNDKTVRNYISKRADLLGAIRLPNTAFAGNAGTSVVTDILILKKRAPGTEYAGVPFVEAPFDYTFGYQNEYFKAHPEMVLGEQTSIRGMHYRNEYSVNPYADRGSLEEQIDKAFEQITGQMDYPAQLSPEKTNYRVQQAEKGTKQGGFVQKDGRIYQNDGGELKEVNTDEKTAKRITGMLGIRDLSRQLLNAQQQGVERKSIEALRRSLNRAYDGYVKEYGFLNSPANKKAFAEDPDRFSLFALEDWDSEKKTATKADIFKVDTIRPNQTVTHADTVKDGLTVSRNTTGGVDVALISRLTGKSETDVTRELIESELAFKNRDGQLVPAETYLSGNVRAKLRDALGLVGIDRDYQHNVDALRQIVPTDIPHEQIFVQLGTPWIPESVYSDFAAYILGGNNHRSWGEPDIQIHRSNQTGNFTIDLQNKRLKQDYRNTQEWGTPRRSFLNLLEAVMNSRSVTVTDKDENGHTIVDRVATAAANEKIEQITKKFQEWLWEDEERTKDLEFLYNETFNNLVTPKYDGSSLTVNGLRAGWSLRPHQADAVQRVISCGGNTLLAHRVGAGKTLEMAAAAMKLKELGIVQKPMFAVPKSLVAQWGKEFTSYFPAAKLLVAEQSDFTPANRKTFANRIATGNYDAIIVSYEQFEKIPISDDFAVSLYQEQIDEIIQAINEAKEESGKNSMSVKDMEKKRKQLEAKVEKLTSKPKDTDSIEFEQLGVDSIFVDEAHNFKNLFYTTSMNNVAGLGNKDGSQRAFDLYTKVRYLQQLNGGRGIVFATATPVMNSMSEMYIMQKYLQSDLLNQLGLSTFDAWAKQFGEVVNGVEIKPSGQGYRIKQSFSRFKNMSELQLLFRNFSDVLTQVPGLKIPRMKGGAVKTVECEAGEFQKQYMQQLAKRADNIKNVDPSKDNMLKITSDGRKIAYTQRMIDPSLPYEDSCKIYKCAEKVVEEYRASKDVKGTQIVFCDMATPKGKSNSAKAAAQEDMEMDAGSAQLYDDLKTRLVKLGIPAKEIAFIHDADTDAKKTKLFADMNDGKVRVLIGSTGKMGVGMNAQKRVVAIHHLDAPWRPGDVEQRDGRAFRQGNINEEVSKYVYIMKGDFASGSFDARLWDIIDRKNGFIGPIMNGENVGREVEDTGEVTVSAAEIKALASGSPLILEQVQLETDINKLENLYMAHRQSVVEARRKLQEAKKDKAAAEASAEKARKDIKNRTDASQDDTFSMKIGSKTFTDKKEAGKALMVQATAKAGETYTKIGSFAGFDVLVMQTKEGIIGLLKADGGYRFHTYPDNTTLMITNMQKVLNGLDSFAQQQEETAAQKAQEIKAQEEMAESEFPKQAELDEKRRRYNEVMEILNPKEEQAMNGDEDDVEESTRRETLSNREVLQMAASEITVEGMTDAERNALEIFNNTLDRLGAEQEHRADLGRQYKDQQFTKGGSRAEADRIRAAMQVSDSKIKTLENRLLSLENKDLLKSVLRKARNVVEAEERARGVENLRKYREKRNRSEATRKYRDRVRAQVLEFAKLMTNPSNKDIRKHVPAELQKTVVDFLGTINLASKTALRTDGMQATKADEQYLKAMKKLRAAIKKNVDTHGLYSGYADLPEDFMETFDAMIEKAESLMEQNSGEFVINRMSAEDLKELSKVLKMLKQHIQTMNTFHNNAMFQHVDDAGESTIGFLDKFRKSKAGGFVYNFLRFDYMRPSMAMEHFGEGGKSISKEFQDGQAVQAFLANKIIDFAKKTYSGAEVKAWSEDVKTFTLSDGETVHIPVAQIMSLYGLNKRPQALTHIYGDGIRIANYKADGKVQLDEGHLVTLGDVQQMIQALTPRQIEVADALQKFMSTECAEWGNYVSMKRFGVEQFGEGNYFPINSDGRYLPATADESPDNAGLYALLNMGFTKELKENAKNRIILYNIFDVFANHTASMTQYRAFALPVLDALRWFNYKNDATSVRDKLSMAFGAPEETRAGSGSKGYAESFVINLIRAYNGTSAQGDPYDSAGLKMLHRFNGAAIAYNLRVVVQQPTAIARAAMILSPAKLSKGLGMSIAQMRKLAEEMEAHSGIAAWKALGFYDTNISRGLTELIKQNPSTLDKVMDVGTKGAEFADRFTWAAMWYAAKDSVNRSAYDSEEAYMKAVTDLFEEVIYKTQVVDSILTKAEFLREKGFVARQLGSFMSEPSATVSMLADAYYKYSDDLQQGKSRSEAWQRNGGNIVKTMAVYAVAQVILSAFQSAWDALRDNDDKDPEDWLHNFMLKYANAFKGNLIDEMLPFGKIPLMSEIYEVIKSELADRGIFDKLGLDMYGNDISSGLSMYIKYAKKGLDIALDKATGQKTNYTTYGMVYNLLKGISDLSGLPLASVTREIVTLWNNTVGFLAPSKKLVTYERAADRKKREGYAQYVQQTGLSQATYNALYDKADVDGDGIEQGEFGPVLLEAIQSGEITEEQAAAAWKANWNKENSTTFEKWRSKNGGAAAPAETPEPTATAAPKRAAATPAPTKAPGMDYDSFKSSAPLYGTEKKNATYSVWENDLKPAGMSLERFSEILGKADADSNGSLKQDELGYALRSAINLGEMTWDQASAVWQAQGWSAKHGFDYWSSRH